MRSHRRTRLNRGTCLLQSSRAMVYGDKRLRKETPRVFVPSFLSQMSRDETVRLASLRIMTISCPSRRATSCIEPCLLSPACNLISDHSEATLKVSATVSIMWVKW